MRDKIKTQREEEISNITKSIENNKKFTVTEGGQIGEQLAQLQSQKSKLPVESVR